MEILINELSLTGQFMNVDKFVEQGLPALLSTLKDIRPATDQLYKKEDLYSSKVTSELTLHDLFVGSLSRKYDEIRRFKSLLAQLFENPYWEGNMKQSVDSKYIYMENDIWGSSLAEACERDKVVLSFKHESFIDRLLPVTKVAVVIDIDNLFEKGHYLELCWKRRNISFEEYCIGNFSGNKLDFSQIDSKEGFNLIIEEADQRLFLEGFRKFSYLSWQEIKVDDGLGYKEYHNRSFFKANSHKIRKFRISGKYRCFGYTHNDVFHVLLFDLKHKLSDQG